MSQTATNSDPIRSVADSLEAASREIESSEADHSVQEFLSKTVYSVFYYFSYGVCFAGHMAGRVIPKDGIVGQGLRDGADAARDAVERIQWQETEKDGFEQSFLEEPKPAKPAQRAKRKTAAKPAARSKSTSRRSANSKA